ncbi:ROK family protein [Clostridium sp. MCC353]|uniref:ROK family transcriptional regulator n=1 Tax=Clostridium sp. MCC353 TaxID=2592646 RepID=UPI001C01BD0F|nr:ROK family transcriptional regulator [Clostridium sp. MCC353]MBT9777344.1 ROK family protein [Clostridium sp. MCC353]
MNVKSGLNQTRMKADNYAAILGTIYKEGPITRTEIARQLEVALPTVTTTIKSLLDTGILKEVPLKEQNNALGRRAAAIDFEETAGYALGIEWGPIGIILYISDLRGKQIAVKKHKMKVIGCSYDTMLSETKQCVDEILSENEINEESIIGIGWATPGMVDSQSGMLVCSSMTGTGWEDLPVKKDLEELLNYPVIVENHVRARAVGQDMFERENRPDVYLYYFAQMGISCCVMSDGEPFGREHFGTGDIGHTIMDIDGPVCNCGKRGCLQTFIGENAIRESAAHQIELGKAKQLKEICENPQYPEIEEIVNAVDMGDDQLKQALLPAVRYMGISIANIINLLNPQLVIVDCALFNGRVLRKYLDQVIYEHNYFRSHLDVEVQYVDANRYTGARGCCALVVQELLGGRL